MQLQLLLLKTMQKHIKTAKKRSIYSSMLKGSLVTPPPLYKTHIFRNTVQLVGILYCRVKYVGQQYRQRFRSSAFTIKIKKVLIRVNPMRLPFVPSYIRSCVHQLFCYWTLNTGTISILKTVYKLFSRFQSWSQ